MNDRWAEMEPLFRERAYAAIDNDPQVLLETDGGPVGMEAELIYARLYGIEGEIVEDGLRLNRVEPRILMPIRLSPWSVPDDPSVPTMRTATYELQSGFVLMHVAAENLPPEVPLQPDFTARLLYVRYRRHS